MQISAAATCGLLLVASNIFMTFAWYAHLKNLAEKPWCRCSCRSPSSIWTSR
jgi:uncharacterized protein (DUF486 family)